MIETIDTHDAWLEARKKGIQASEAAAVLGISPNMTAYDLYNLKIGKSKDKDLSDNERVAYGKAAEEYIRGLFGLDYPQYEITYRPFDIYRNDELPFIGATLDGELFDLDTFESGVLECKTCLISSATLSAQWQDGKIPQHYYAQVLHQLAATGFSFACVAALLRYDIDGEKFSKIIYRHYRREDHEDEIAYLIEEETKFWDDVKNKHAPALKIDL